MSGPRIGYLHHPTCALHDMGAGHPEQPARLAAIERAVDEAELASYLDRVEAPAADRETLLRAHTASYVDHIHELAPGDGLVMIDADTTMNPHSLTAALHSAGAGIAAVDGVLTGRWPMAFCAGRPPGHHAERSTSMGFCFFGNVAIAALHAVAAHGLQRVAICDFDVHHGNGTEDIVDGNPHILFCSSFQHPLFPGYYRPDEPGRRVNCPLSPGSNGQAFREAVTSRWLPELEAFAPELVLISAGFDAHADDPVGGLFWNEADFRWITERLVEVAGRHAGGRIVSVLEGGYDLDALGRCTVAHLHALLGTPDKA